MRIRALASRIVRQILRDKRTLALMLIAPLFILTLVHFLFETNEEDELLKIGVYHTSEDFNQALMESGLEVVAFDEGKDIESKVKEKELAAFIKQEDNSLAVTYENSTVTNTSQVKTKIQGTLVAIQAEQLKRALNQHPQLQEVMGEQVTVTNYYIFGSEDSTFFDSFSPVLVGFFVFFFVFLISGIALLRERTTGTLEKILATPMKRGEIVVGYLVGYGIFAVIQTLLVVLYATYVLGIHIEGSILLVFLVNIILALIALSLGTLLSTFANSEFQMMQFIPIVIVPQIFFSGIIAVDSMASWLQAVAHVMPLYYAGDSLQGIMIRGESFADIQGNLGVLLIFAIVLSLLNVVGLKRYRKI